LLRGSRPKNVTFLRPPYFQPAAGFFLSQDVICELVLGCFWKSHTLPISNLSPPHRQPWRAFFGLPVCNRDVRLLRLQCSVICRSANPSLMSALGHKRTAFAHRSPANCEVDPQGSTGSSPRTPLSTGTLSEYPADYFVGICIETSTMAEQNTLRLPRVDFSDCRLRLLPLEE
jgi:hypothetical protein